MTDFFNKQPTHQFDCTCTKCTILKNINELKKEQTVTKVTDLLTSKQTNQTKTKQKPNHDPANILEVNNLTKIYKGSTQGVRNLTFSIKKGEIHAFLGENGSGKTTTIKSIINAYANYEGEILIDGYDNKTPESKDKLGYVPENALFPAELTTYDYLYSLARLSRVPAKIAKAKILKYLEKFGILNLKNKRPVNFSSGQKKKVLLIQALIHDPELIILDEPTANLDPSARFEVFDILHELNKEGKTIFVCSHILKEMEAYVNSLTLIHKGNLIYTGPKEKDLETIYYELIIKDNEEYANAKNPFANVDLSKNTHIKENES